MSDQEQAPVPVAPLVAGETPAQQSSVTVEDSALPMIDAGPEVVVTADVPVADDATTSEPVPPASAVDAVAGEEKMLELGSEEALADYDSLLPKREPSTTVQQDAEVFLPLNRELKSNEVNLSIPGDTLDRTNDVLETMPNVSLEDTATGDAWVRTLRASQFALPASGWFADTTLRPNVAYRQSIPSNKGKLSAGIPKFNDKVETKLTGESAVLRVRSLMGMGSIVQIPLWHSGFWITLKAPSDGAQLELNRRLTEEKITLGRQTYGLAYSNNSVFFAGWIIDFALQHIYATTLKPEVATNIREHISTLDIGALAWGLACVIWPRGFPYSRSVLNQKTKQNSVIREILNIGKCQWTDQRALTEWQTAHMSARHGSTMTVESLARYRDEFVNNKGRSIEVKENLAINLRVPNVEQYLTSGQRWVDGIVKTVDTAFSLEPGTDARDNYILAQGKASAMRQFSHWVESVVADDHVIDDAATLELTMAALSSENDIREKFFKEVRKYIEECTMSVIAIPAAEDEDNSPLPRFPHLLVLDALSVFFILNVMQAGKVQSREI